MDINIYIKKYIIKDKWKQCSDGKIRNLLTNRCVKTTSPVRSRKSKVKNVQERK